MANKQMHHLKVGDNIFEIVDSVARSSISGAPTIVSLSSAMSDTSKLYLYIGSETGYTSGDWYYHNGTSWVSGGQYGDMQLDTSLTTSGMAADAKAVGDKFNSFATSATAGQSPIADGAGGWQWGDVATSGDSVPTNVRQAIFNLLDNNAFANDDTYTADLAVLEAWASVATAISLTPATASISGSSTRQLTAVTTPSGASVSWTSSDTSVATVSNSGLVTGVGNGTCTIIATSGSVSATCAVTVSGFATLLSITATYTQSGTIYSTDNLDSLKSDLVVTANYDDDRSLPVTGYELSGTLTEGTSTITVTYGGKTDTFDVVVSAYSRLPAAYQEVEWVGVENANSTPTAYIQVGSDVLPVYHTLHVECKPFSILGEYDSPAGFFGTGGWEVYYTSNGTALANYVGSQLLNSFNYTIGDWDTFDFSVKKTDTGVTLLTYQTTKYAFNGKIKSAYITDTNNVKTHDYVPCYRKADGEIGVYDLITDTFFANSGTGTLVKGNNV